MKRAIRVRADLIRSVAALSAACLALLPRAHAAPCCAGSAAAPAIISGDDHARLGFSASQSSVIGDAPEEGIPVFRTGDDRETSQAYRLEGAMLLSDRWQAGTLVPLIHHEARSRSGSQASTGFGDVRASVAYEALPEWEYSAWKPKGYAFLELTVPTGSSIYETTAQTQEGQAGTEATGRGFYSVAMGSVLVKRWSLWDAYAIPEIHYSFARDFEGVDDDDNLRIEPRGGASLALGVGASPGSGAARIGLRLQPIYQQPKRVISFRGAQATPYQLSWDTAVEATYLFSDEWSATAAYVDQTLIGPAVNTSLSRTFAVGLQHHWLR